MCRADTIQPSVSRENDDAGTVMDLAHHPYSVSSSVDDMGHILKAQANLYSV
jgi:hypothetical protein